MIQDILLERGLLGSLGMHDRESHKVTGRRGKSEHRAREKIWKIEDATVSL